MRVVRGRHPTIAGDHAVSEQLLELAGSGDLAIRVWIPHRQVAFGRRDARLEGYERARGAAQECGFPPVERNVGGRAVAYDGATTIAVARAEPVSDLRVGIGDRYETLMETLETVLEGFGLATTRGEPDESFCPGSHSLSVDGRKIAGIAQRVQTDAALVAAVLVVDSAPLVGVLESVYDALEVPFDPDSVGGLQQAGGPSDPNRIVGALEETLIGD